MHLSIVQIEMKITVKREDETIVQLDNFKGVVKVELDDYDLIRTKTSNKSTLLNNAFEAEIWSII